MFPNNSAERKDTTDKSARSLFLSSTAAARERISWVQVHFRDMEDVHHALLGVVEASALFDEIGLVGRALPADSPPPQANRKQIFESQGICWLATCLLLLQ